MDEAVTIVAVLALLTMQGLAVERVMADGYEPLPLIGRVKRLAVETAAWATWVFVAAALVVIHYA